MIRGRATTPVVHVFTDIDPMVPTSVTTLPANSVGPRVLTTGGGRV